VRKICRTFFLFCGGRKISAKHEFLLIPEKKLKKHGGFRILFLLFAALLQILILKYNAAENFCPQFPFYKGATNTLYACFTACKRATQCPFCFGKLQKY
jgi:hypothetical protein